MTTRATTTEAVATTSFAAASADRPEPERSARLLAELFEAHAALVLGICRGMLRDPHEAEDAAQQTFLSAYASVLGGTKPRDAAPWLATIARNECRSLVQRKMREPLPELGSEAERSDPAFRAAQAAEVESLRLALAQLPRQQRRAFLLREFNGLTYNELATALGVSRPAVESLLFRARQRLRGSLRAAVAAAVSLPASLREFFAQFASGTPEGPTTLAKLGAAPVVAKLAAGTAGAAFVTAGAVAVLPVGHHKPLAKSALMRSHSAAAHRRGIRGPATLTAARVRPRPRPLAVVSPNDSDHRNLLEHRDRLEHRQAVSQGSRTESADRSSGAAGGSGESVNTEPVSDSGTGAAGSLSQSAAPDASGDTTTTGQVSAPDSADSPGGGDQSGD
jgi:RNA polymerase sigma-70 factor (ECF subfamily)